MIVPPVICVLTLYVFTAKTMKLAISVLIMLVLILLCVPVILIMNIMMTWKLAENYVLFSVMIVQEMLLEVVLSVLQGTINSLGFAKATVLVGTVFQELLV